MLVASAGFLGCGIIDLQSRDSWAEEILLQNTGLRILWTLLRYRYVLVIVANCNCNATGKDVKMPGCWFFLCLVIRAASTYRTRHLERASMPSRRGGTPLYYQLSFCFSGPLSPLLWRIVGSELTRRQLSLAQTVPITTTPRRRFLTCTPRGSWSLDFELNGGSRGLRSYKRPPSNLPRKKGSCLL